MKSILICFLSLAILASCNNKKTNERTDDKTVTDKDKENKEVKDDKDNKDNKDNINTDNTTTTTTRWSIKDETDFVSSCVNEAVKNTTQEVAEKYCQCMLEKMEKEYPDVNRAATLSDAEIQEVMAKYKDGCLKQ